jgi:hypothetical protein
MDSPDHTAQRRQALLRLGADPADIDEFLDHSRAAGWWPTDIDTPLSIPDDDLPQIADWEEYAESAATYGAWNTLRERLVQLRFPVRKGISSEAPYRDATLRGRAPVMAETGLELECPETLELRIHSSLGGRIPVVIPDSRHDFESLVQALTARNEPVPVPPSMGACLVNGLNNWDRIASLRRRWEATPQAHREFSTWAEQFRSIVPQTHLYKDRIIILSRGAYSDVAAHTVGVEEHEWLEQSLAIRLEHECIHALTLRVFGSLRHDLLEELVADWAALIRVRGRYEPQLARLFLGLEGESSFRSGGRLEVYRGSPPMSDAAFELMQRIARHLIHVLDDLGRAENGQAVSPTLLCRRVIDLLATSAEELVASR